MKQAVGVLLMLLGVICWHVASNDSPVQNITDVWDDILEVMNGSQH